MKARRLLLGIPLGLVLLSLVVAPALAWSTGGDIDCDEVMVRIKNNGGSHITRYYEGWVKVDGVTVFTDSGTVAWNQWATISWNPPVGTSGDVQAYVAIRNSATSAILDSHTIEDDLDCQPDYQLNLSHIECVQQGVGGNYVEVHFVLLDVPDDITPGAFVDFTDGVNLWQAPRGAHTGNVWHYTAYLPDGYYNITAASVDVDGYTVYLHNPGDYAGNYFCTPLTHDYTVTPNQDCVLGWGYTLTVPEPTTSITLVSGAESGAWSLPFILENNSGQEPTWHVVWADGHEEDITGPTINEDGQCQQVHRVSYDADPDCEGAVAFYQIDGGAPVPYFTYSWTDPYVTEDVDAPAFDIPTNAGELYSLTTIPAQHFDEPADCEVDLEHSYTVTPDQDCVLGWNYALAVPEPTTSITLVSGAESGPWLDVYTLENNGGQEPIWHVVWADGYEQDVSGATIYEDRTCLPPGDFSISTTSSCEANDAMVFDTVIGTPYNTTGSLSVLWYYPNGNAFVTGETSLGDVALTVGTNIFSSSLTKEQLVAAIGDNNLTGGNPANDVNYDRLDLYSYVVILRLGDEEITLVSNTEDLWGSCDQPGREIPRCPECGAPVWEQSYDGMALVWFSPTPCVIDWEKWCIELTETVRAWSQYMFYVEIHGELLAAGEAIGADGNTWYVLEFDPGDGDFILWGADGKDDRFRNYGPVYKYSACSVAPGWQDTTAEGFLIVRNGMNRSDIFEFLIREDDAFFVGEEHRGTLAIEWVNSHLPEGPLVVGTLMELPAISR